MDVADWIVVVPVIAPRAETAAARATWDVDAPNLLVVDNTPSGEYAGGPWEYYAESGRNLGVAASWNRGLALGREFTVFLSSYLVLDEGLARTVERMIAAANDYGCVTWQAMHLFGITRLTVNTCGVFDEHYKVAYYEDCDAIVRWELGGCHSPENPMPKIAVPGICPQARTLELGLASPPMDANRARYLAKWGGPFTKEVYKTPFNDPNLTIKDWGPAEPPNGVKW